MRDRKRSLDLLEGLDEELEAAGFTLPPVVINQSEEKKNKVADAAPQAVAAAPAPAVFFQPAPKAPGIVKPQLTEKVVDALHLAITTGKDISAILAVYPEAALAEKNEQSPLLRAVVLNRHDAIRQLLKAGAEMFGPRWNSAKLSPYKAAQKGKNAETLAILDEFKNKRVNRVK